MPAPRASPRSQPPKKVLKPDAEHQQSTTAWLYKQFVIFGVLMCIATDFQTELHQGASRLTRAPLKRGVTLAILQHAWQLTTVNASLHLLLGVYHWKTLLNLC